MALRHMLTPLRLGPVTVPNRIVRTAHGTGIGGGTMNDALIEYHAARARGGVGLTVIEAAQVHRTFYPFFNAGAPGLVEGYRRLMERVRPHGMKVFQQLGHLGNEIPQADGTPPWSSSDTVGALLGIQSQPMTKAQVAELVDCYAAAAKDCEAGGLDGVEVHMAHGYLLQQFLSPLWNFRDDEYGGGFENRVRLPLADSLPDQVRPDVDGGAVLRPGRHLNAPRRRRPAAPGAPAAAAPDSSDRAQPAKLATCG